MLPRIALGLVLVAMAAPIAAQSVAELDSAAGFIFTGRITKARSVTMEIVPVSNRTVVVEVTEVLRTPAAVGSFAGRAITLLVLEGGSTSTDEVATFFAAGWLAGDGLALRELGRVPAQGPGAMTPASVRLQLQDPQARALAQRVATASLVVMGRVTRDRAVEGPPLRSEHDPMWHEATIAIDSVLKGSHESREVRVLYPASRDVMWAASPKLTVGRQGILLLRRDEPSLRPAMAGTRATEYTAIHRSDFQARGQATRIRTLIAAPR